MIKNKIPFLVAEISANHCGDKKRFLKHILLARQSGADLVKIQTYEPRDITLKTKDKKFNIKIISYEKTIKRAWNTKDLSKTGIIGNPTNSSADKGKKILDLTSRTLKKIIDEMK